MYLSGLAALDARRLSAVRDFECLPRGARVPPQPEILDGRRVARVRLRRPFDPGRRAVEECLGDG